jgi:hypothetical protein
MPPGMFVHSPDLTEVGSFYVYGDTDFDKQLASLEAKIPTRYAVGTTVPDQRTASMQLEVAGWTRLGHRYNQYHGPNFITLWAKEFPGRGPTSKLDPLNGDGVTTGFFFDRDAPPWSYYCCGLWLSARPFGGARFIRTKFLAAWVPPEPFNKAQAVLVKRQGWKLFGERLWHNAEPLSSRNKYENGDEHDTMMKGWLRERYIRVEV